jgi:hypothetical protein
MTNMTNAQLQNLIEDLAKLMEQDLDIDTTYYSYLLNNPWAVLQIIDLICAIDESHDIDDNAYYLACVFAIEVCLGQLQTSYENGNILAEQTLDQLMSKMAKSIPQHTINFWIPILNAFYSVHVELSAALKHAYIDLANTENSDLIPADEFQYMESIRDLMIELQDLSVFDQADHFFSQSYAMPTEFFMELVADLYSLDEGHEVALLMLLHPNAHVRENVVSVLNEVLPQVTLSSKSLSRLQAIKHWYPASYHIQFERWIKHQRHHHGVIFHREQPATLVRLKASEIDGSGAQGVFVHIRNNRKNQLCGLLLKASFGIKDAWMTPMLSAKDIENYYNEAFDDSIMLRDVELDYLVTITNHFLALTIEKNKIPPLHLLEIQEILGVQFIPKKISCLETIEKLTIQIHPFTPERVALALKNTHEWVKNKRFTESWYAENPMIDRIVNSHCSFVKGIKVCEIEKAVDDVLANEFELQRQEWLFHFIWVALWLKSHARKNEKVWEDALLVAHAISSNIALHELPILREICYQSVINSMETMQERRTHLHRQN